MKNVWQVLRQKEAALYRVRLEIAALRLVGPLLEEEPKKRPILRRLLSPERKKLNA